MDWIFPSFVVAAVIHIVEEYVFPGGFLGTMKGFNPRFASSVTVRFAIVINTLFVLLCVAGALIAQKNLVFSLSVASLLFFNGLIHAAGTIRTKRYVPGVVSGTALYLPLSLYAYYLHASSGQLTPMEGVVSALLGVLYQAVPVGYLTLTAITRRA